MYSIVLLVPLVPLVLVMPGEWRGWLSPVWSRAWALGGPWSMSHCQPSPAFNGLGWVQREEMSTLDPYESSTAKKANVS